MDPDKSLMENKRSSSYGSLEGFHAAAPGLFEHKNSTELTAGIIVADVVGAGILSMAVAVGHLGWLLGSIAIVLMLLMNVHTSILMWKVHSHFPETQTYRDLVEAAFGDTTDSTRRVVTTTLYGMQTAFLFLMLGLYMLTMGKSVGMFFYNIHVCLPHWSLLVCIVVLPISILGKNMGSWSTLIWGNCFTILMTIAIPLTFFGMMGVDKTRPHDSHFAAVSPELSVASAFSGFSTFAFGLSGQFIVVEIISEMKKPEEFPKAYAKLSAPFQGAAFLLVGFGGYYYKGGNITGMINQSLPFGWEFRLAAACLALHMVVTYTIKGTVLCKELQEYMHQVTEKSISLDNLWVAVVSATLAVTLLIAQLVPFFSDLVDLLGASMTPTCCWIVPAVLYMRTIGWTQVGKFEQMVIVIEILFSIALTLIGTGVSMSRIVHHWEEYGGPFSCHCEGMWSTCDCSAFHPGMETCLTPVPTALPLP